MRKDTKGNAIYMFDMDAIMNFIFGGDIRRTNDSEITETYVANETNELQLINKQLREVKGNNSDTEANIKYGLLKVFIDVLRTTETEHQTIGESVVFNTLYLNGLIKENEQE